MRACCNGKPVQKFVLMNEKKPTFKVKCLSCLFRRWHHGRVVAAFRSRGSHAGHQEPDPGGQAFGEGTAEGPLGRQKITLII